eukprot:SAG31_NODE_5109_length_2739_cov_2.238636_2_plen_56_part_00
MRPARQRDVHTLRGCVVDSHAIIDSHALPIVLHDASVACRGAIIFAATLATRGHL